MSTEISRADAERTIEAFLPISAGGEFAIPRDRRVGLRELGLPFETDPAITRHLAGFLARASPAASANVATVGGRSMVRPDVVLFNGGFFRPTVARQRVVQALGAWFDAPPRVLTSGSLDAAVALGAAVYGRLRAGVGPSLSFVKAGSGICTTVARPYLVPRFETVIRGTVSRVPFTADALACATTPRLPHSSTTAGSVTISRNSAFSRSMIGFGVAAGATIMCQDAAS